MGFRGGEVGAGRLLIAVASASAVGSIASASALGAGTTSASLTATIPVAPPPVMSVTLSASSDAYGSCVTPSGPTPGLAFPNGQCNTPTFTATAGTASEDIDVQGSNAVPSDGGTQWTLFPTADPGANQFYELTHENSSGSTGTILSDTPACDLAFDDGCAATAGEIGLPEELEMLGPSSSSDSSSSFTTTVTWTAVAAS